MEREKLIHPEMEGKCWELAKKYFWEFDAQRKQGAVNVLGKRQSPKSDYDAYTNSVMMLFTELFGVPEVKDV